MTTSRARKALAATAVTVGLATTSAAPAWSAPKLADGNGFATGGKSIDLRVASGDGTPLDPGMYQTTLPVDETSRYASISRGEGERLQIGVLGSATWKNNAWSVSDGSQGLEIKLTTPDGETTCATSTDSLSTTGAPGLLKTNVAVDPKATKRITDSGDSADACRKATSYRLEVKRTNSGDNSTPMPVQIAIVRTPKVNGEVKTPSGDVEALSTQPLDASQTMEPGAGFANATTLPSSEGGYTVEAQPGRRMFFRVHLSWGQRMSVGWEVPKNGSGYNPTQDMNLDLQVYNPALNEVTVSGSGSNTGYLFTSTSSGTDPKQLGAYTAPIDYGNADRETGGDDSVQWQAMPGWYYVALDVTPSSSSDKLDESKTIPSVISVRVQGNANEGPAMDVAQPAPATLSTEGTSGSNPLLWGGALVLGLGAVAGLAFVLWRRDNS
ncbi:hypothetical protein H7F30_07690 [Dermacoccus sp. PAMC28757]|uniref:hypothetical protein n=1 Tax=Dermacoccus sp. PAMC28757 TaxID=2762331 RepID=UPI00164D11AB|nr:hypothetical protein [Dermacoccus sp. PAMC28757]QNK51570.1 hypothetical protein H7F30_07690 [Dermacoccus sp. PAMC28757]